MNHIQVTAAIIEKDGKILIAKRDKDGPLKDKCLNIMERKNSQILYCSKVDSRAQLQGDE
jgi:uncharacterized membrane protein YcaP (DUF421 family)